MKRGYITIFLSCFSAVLLSFSAGLNCSNEVLEDTQSSSDSGDLNSEETSSADLISDAEQEQDSVEEPIEDIELSDSESDGSAYYCSVDGDCGQDRGCLAGVCRNECISGEFCYFVISGSTCVDGLCVECAENTDCHGDGNQVCNTNTYLCEPRIIDPSKTIIGVMYHQWWIPGRWQANRGNYVYEPLLGHYENSDPQIISQHLDWAELAGINTFVLDTWITDRDWSWVEPNSLAVMDQADQRGFKYFLLIDGWFEFEGSDDGYDAHAIAAKVVERFSNWFDRPGYLKVDGKPVIFFWAAWSKPCSVFDLIRSGLEGQLGPVYLTGHNGDTECWDRVMMYNSYTAESGDYDRQIARQEYLWDDWEENSHPWAPTTIPGYDDTHVRDGNPPVPLDPDFFRLGLQTAMLYNQFEDPWLFVCSWSEWHEGSNIEPSSDFENPLIFLEVMREELELAGWVQ